jgi:type I restriction enzyme M protein
MPKSTRKKSHNQSNGANLGFEEKLWLAADKLRGHMDASEYKHVVLGLIFLKYISDAFEERHAWLLREAADPKSATSTPPRVCWLPDGARIIPRLKRQLGAM